jgi:two-component system chemotaxis response regulator CheY
MEKTIKILVVDDFATMRKVVRNLLKQAGYENIVEAEDGVSDWNMPNMTGIELLKAVRADADMASMPFLMVTAEALQDNVIAAVKAGVSNYIVKPFTAEILNEKIVKIMEKIG